MALLLNVCDPFVSLSPFDRRMDSVLRLADRIHAARPNTDTTTYHVPNYEYQRDNNNFNLQVELPGVAKEHIEVEMNSGNLILTARRFRPSQGRPVSEDPEQSTEDNGKNDANTSQTEKPSRVYKLRVKVGRDVEEEGIKAEYNHGILSMSIPLRKPSTRKISISDQ